MNHDVVIYIISMLATIFFISSIILAALLYESKQKRKETEKQLRDLLDMPIPEHKIETHGLASGGSVVVGYGKSLVALVFGDGNYLCGVVNTVRVSGMCVKICIQLKVFHN